jgi:ribonuclease R
LSTKKSGRGRGKGSEFKGLRAQDPHLEREMAKYGQPLPSREFIQQVLESEGKPLTFGALAGLLSIKEDELLLFQRRLGAMARDGQLMQNRREEWCLAAKLDLIRGKVEGHPDGFGFVVPDEGGEDLFLSPKEMHQVLHGDRVLVRVAGIDRRGRREGKIVEVLERGLKKVVGRYYQEHGVGFLVAENRRINQDILIPLEHAANATHGQVVTAEIIGWPSKHTEAVGRIVEVLGDFTGPGMEIEIALRKHDLPHVFPPETEALAKKLPKKVLKKDWAGREDLTQLPLVTIDGETARDFDDAVYCEKQGRGWRLVVAIADVSHYVIPGDALDTEGYSRGNSIYFPRRVIPMLPEELSNGLCSLNPQVERLCMACDINISAQGDLKDYRFYPAVMFSHARLTYEQVWGWLSGAEEPGKEHKPLFPHLQNLEKLFQLLLKNRQKRGAIDFESVETRMYFDDAGKITRIAPVQRNDAHKLIEECMLAANTCAADFLLQQHVPGLYRIHEGPTPEKLQALRGFMGEFGLQLGGGDEPQAKDYAALLEKIKPRPDAQLLQTVMLRSLKQAMYSPDNAGHFGLAYDHYTHFTSPIRRYPDLLVHRAIKAGLKKEKPAKQPLAEIGMHCSATERRADEASRDVEAWLKTYYMREHVGNVYEGTVSSATSFGIFVALDEVFVEGLVHVTELGQDYFHYDQSKHWLIGERSGKRFRLGDRVTVKVVRADIETSKIDFTLVEKQREIAPAAAPEKKAEKGTARKKKK